MLLLLKIFAVLALLSLTALAVFFFWASAGSYPQSKYNEVIADIGAGDGPTVRPILPEQAPFTVITYNIGYLSGLANAASSDGSVEQNPRLFEDNLKTAVAALKAQDPDFIGLQEIDLAARRSYYVNQVTELAKALDLQTAAVGINWDKNYVPFPFWPLTHQFGRTVAGQALLSRYPISRSERIVLEPVQSQPFYYRAFYLDRLAQIAEVNLNENALVVINVHLEAFDQSTRLNQTQVVKDLAERYAAQYPVLLMGDFNSALTRSSETDPTIQLLLESTLLKSAVPVEQLQDQSIVTFPSNTPSDALDYIFYTPDRLELIDSQVVKDAALASDHLPLMARFRLR